MITDIKKQEKQNKVDFTDNAKSLKLLKTKVQNESSEQSSL